MKNYKFYQGFSCRFSGKVPISNGKELVLAEEINELNPKSYGARIAQGYLLLDFDTEQDSKIALKIIKAKKYKTHIVKTDRGIHTIWRNPETTQTNSSAMPLLCGLVADIKSNTGNKVMWECLKNNGADRTIIQECEMPEPLPQIFWEINRKKKQIPDWKTIGAGERNEQLFNYCGVLSSAGYEPEQGKNAIQILNDFVLAEPLPQTEIDTITREEAFEYKSKSESKKASYSDIAIALAEQHDLIYHFGNLYAWNEQEKRYKMCNTRTLEKMIFEYNHALNKTARNEILAYFDIMAREIEQQDTNYIWFKNGLLNIKTKKIEPHKKTLILNQIEHNYNQKADTTYVMKTLLSWTQGDLDKATTLAEICGYCMCAGLKEMQQFFVLTGTGANGKSTYLDLLNATIGKKNISSLDISDFYSTFRLALMQDKLANICADVSDIHIKGQAAAYIKQLCTGDPMTIERKFKDPVSNWQNKAVLVFSANNVPTFTDPTGAVARRAVIIPFEADFSKTANKNIKRELLTDKNIEAFIVLSIDTFLNAATTGTFTHTPDMIESAHEFRKANDSVLQFWEEIEPSQDVDGRTTSDVYQDYARFCIESGLKAISKNKFSRQLKINFGYTTKTTRGDFKTERIYSIEQ